MEGNVKIGTNVRVTDVPVEGIRLLGSVASARLRPPSSHWPSASSRATAARSSRVCVGSQAKRVLLLLGFQSPSVPGKTFHTYTYLLATVTKSHVAGPNGIVLLS